MDPCIVVWLSRNTNKMQLCNRIYYFKVYWRLNMFRATHRSSSEALNLYLQPLIYIPMWWPVVPTQPWQWPVTTWVYKPEATNTSLELLMKSGVPLETCWAFRKLWNNKFCYIAASCWYFYWVCESSYDLCIPSPVGDGGRRSICSIMLHGWKAEGFQFVWCCLEKFWFRGLASGLCRRWKGYAMDTRNWGLNCGISYCWDWRWQ